MESYRNGSTQGPVTVSPKLDGVYAKATKEGIFSKSGKPLDLPRISGRLKRHFRKHPAGVLEGELVRKNSGIEQTAGAVRAGGKAAGDVRLHIFPDQGPRPFPIGSVRRVRGKVVKDEKGVQKAYRKALRKGHEGVVIRNAAGEKSKMKPQEDAEFPVHAVKGGPRGVLELRHPDGGTFKVQSRAGVAAKEGDQVQVRYSGKTAKGMPKAAVAQRVRNDHDFQEMNMKQKFKRAMQRMFAARMSEEEQLAADRRAVKRGAVIGGASLLAGGALLRKARGPVENPLLKRYKKPKAMTKAVPKLKGQPQLSPREQEIWAGKSVKQRTDFSERQRDRLDTIRDAAVTTGALASGGAAVIGARQWAKTNREGRAAIKQVLPKLDPKEVVREGIKQIGDKAKGAANQYLPTFTKGGKKLMKVLKKKMFSAAEPDAAAKAKAKEKRKTLNAARIRNGLVGAAAGSFLGGQVHGGKSGYKGARVGAGLGALYGVISDPKRRAAIDELQTASFCTPASALFEFGGKEQWREEGTNTYADPLKVASGMQRAYHRTDAGGRPIIEQIPIAHAQTIKAALNKADKIKRTANRGGKLAKDVVSTVSGKPRERDAAGRVKKREWEKPWFREGVKKVAIAGGILGGATVLKKSPKARDAVRKASKAVADKANSIIPGIVPHHFSKRDETPKTDAVASGVGGAAAGALFGDSFSRVGKEAKAHQDLLKKRAEMDSQRRTAALIGDDWKVPKKKPAPFATGKLTNAERLERGIHEAGIRYKKKVRGSTIKGGLIGAATGAGLSMGISKLRQKEKGKGFSTPASGLFHFDEIAQDAGWDIRDPRGKSARVFAPGSRKRERREKEWHEKIENERKLWKAGIGAAAVAGLVAGRKLKKGPAAAGKVVKPGGITMSPALKSTPAVPAVRGLRKAPARRLRPAGE